MRFEECMKFSVLLKLKSCLELEGISVNGRSVHGFMQLASLAFDNHN